MDDFHNLSDKVAVIQEDISSIKEQSSELLDSNQEYKERLQSLTDRVNKESPILSPIYPVCHRFP